MRKKMTINHVSAMRCMIALISGCLLKAVLLLSVATAYASLPLSLNYQGYLTDSSGVPAHGDLPMTFRIYATETATTPLWSNSLTVSVNQGVFSVELGSATNTFPVNMFETPLWLGLSVGSEAEMTPRRPITATAFAYKAQDANMLDGNHASAYDQSAHLADTGNPHGITPSQIGAAAESMVQSHTGDTSNPHNVTATMTGALEAATFASHETNALAHHLPYTDSAAINAMGVKSDTNALHHDKYTDASAVTAMLANDGAGSTLDADRIDGLEASEIIDASQDEVRTPVSSLPYSITTPGAYFVTGHLDGSAGGIDIAVDNVTLDLMGFTIDGNMVNDYGINFTGHGNITIRNGTVRRFGRAGIIQSGAVTNGNAVIDMHVMENGSLGSSYLYSGIFINGDGSQIERCTVYNNSATGISVADHSEITNNVVYQNGTGILTGTHAMIADNIVRDNAGTGIGADFYSIFYRNNVSGNTTGIYFGTGSVLIGNTVSGNSAIYAVQGGTESLLRSNMIRNNQRWGLFTGNGNLIESNNFADNNTSNTANEGGLLVTAGNRITGNNFTNNHQNNLVIAGSGNTIEANLLTTSGNGIRFTTSGNFYGNNRAYGNSVDFNLGATSQTTHPYLPNIGF